MSNQPQTAKSAINNPPPVKNDSEEDLDKEQEVTPVPDKNQAAQKSSASKPKQVTHKISFVLTDEQYEKFSTATEALSSLGIPVAPKTLIQTLICSKSSDEITDDFLSIMRKLINHGKRELSGNKSKGSSS